MDETRKLKFTKQDERKNDMIKKLIVISCCYFSYKTCVLQVIEKMRKFARLLRKVSAITQDSDTFNSIFDDLVRTDKYDEDTLMKY